MTQRRFLGALGIAVFLLAAVFLGVFTGTSRAQDVESMGYKLHKTSSMFGGPKSAITSWFKANPSTEIVSFAIDKSNNVYIITK